MDWVGEDKELVKVQRHNVLADHVGRVFGQGWTGEDDTQGSGADAATLHGKEM